MKKICGVICGFVLIALLSTYAFADKGVVVLYESGCRSHFIVDGPRGYYLIEWYGGHDPSKGDVIVGDISSTVSRTFIIQSRIEKAVSMLMIIYFQKTV